VTYVGWTAVLIVVGILAWSLLTLAVALATAYWVPENPYDVEAMQTEWRMRLLAYAAFWLGGTFLVALVIFLRRRR
jgi:hypothetical protein